MADKHAPTQLDIEHNQTDRAIRAVRDFQKGAATSSFVMDTLSKLKDNQMLYVSLATRVPVSQLKLLATSSVN